MARHAIAVESRPLDQIAADGRRADEALGVPDFPPQPYPVTPPANASVYVYEPRGWGRLLWLIPLSPYLLVIGVIIMTFLNKPKPSASRKLTAEERAVQRANRGSALHARGEHHAAIEEYTHAIELNPRFTSVWHSRGQMHLLTGHVEKAHSDFDTAVSLAPHFLDAIAARGHTRLLLQQEDLGLADLETVLSLDAANATALVTRAEYWNSRGEFDRAIADWTETIEAGPASGDFYLNRGLLYYLHGDYDRAVSDQTEAIRLDPSSAVAWNNRGAALLKRGDWGEAAADLREAIRLDPKLPNSYKHLAWLQATCPESEYRDGAEAVANATRALELTDWKQSEWLEVLAAAHAEAGNFKEAVRWQQKHLDQSPPEAEAERHVRLEMYEGEQPFRDFPDGVRILATTGLECEATS
jgi:tetratricopeptide (TPR) repeat protein